MIIEHWEHHEVKKDGTFKHARGAVGTKLKIEFNSKENLCHCRTCQEGNPKNKEYILISEGLKGDCVKGVTIYLENEADKKRFLDFARGFNGLE